MAIKSATRTGTLAGSRPLPTGEGVLKRRLATWPMTMKIKTGTPMVPNAPSGSRMKILSSIQVNFQSPRSIIVVPIREWSGQ